VEEEVGFRTTRVRTFDTSRVSVPNSLLLTGVVDNMGERRFRRFKTTVGIQYDTPPERVEAFCQGIRQIVRANPLMRQDLLEVYLNDFGASSLDILVYVFFAVPDWDTELRQRQNFMVEILRLARELHVEFAFPTQTLHVAGTPERPAPDPRAVDEEEMWRIVNDFGQGGSLSHPDGSERWRSSPPKPAPRSDDAPPR
jgi:MscS family membrane protein